MDEGYYLARMEASIALAGRATNTTVKLIHLDMAGRYSVAAACQSAEPDKVSVAEPAETPVIEGRPFA